ncbi:MAG: lasso peptide biosynthesis B2 protein [Anaerolineae bacterium]|nr:lasso peptide biosynthesis B2 protein [Anaerolineae bacterium]
MRRLRKFLRLPAADRKLLVKSFFLVWGVRLGLWLLPFVTLRRLLAWAMRPGTRKLEGEGGFAEKVAWAVTAASRYVPSATCLTQAFATQVLLGRRGLPARLHIGVVKGGDGRLQAHAWVESNGVVVIGGSGPDVERYKPLLALDEAAP